MEATNLQFPPPLSYYIPPTAQTRVLQLQPPSLQLQFSVPVESFPGPAFLVKVDRA